jgi:hypothetical protein
MIKERARADNHQILAGGKDFFSQTRYYGTAGRLNDQISGTD